jgi:hypothetical protein
MPPSLRRRPREEHPSPQQPDFSDSDEVDESHVEPDMDEGDTMGDDLDGLEGDEDLEEEDALGEYVHAPRTRPIPGTLSCQGVFCRVRN